MNPDDSGLIKCVLHLAVQSLEGVIYSSVYYFNKKLLNFRQVPYVRLFSLPVDAISLANSLMVILYFFLSSMYTKMDSKQSTGSLSKEMKVAVGISFLTSRKFHCEWKAKTSNSTPFHGFRWTWVALNGSRTENSQPSAGMANMRLYLKPNLEKRKKICTSIWIIEPLGLITKLALNLKFKKTAPLATDTLNSA